MFAKIRKRYKTIPTSLKLTFWFVFCSFFQKGISTLCSPIFNRILTVEEYGLFSVFSSWNSIFVIFATLNLTAGFLNVKLSTTHDVNEKNKIVSSLQALSTFIALIFFFLFLLLHKQFEQLTGLPFIVLVIMFSSYIFSTSFNFTITKDKFNGKYVRMVIVTVIFTILSPLLTILFLIYKPDSRAITRIIIPILVALVYELFFFVYNFWKGRSFFNKQIWIEALLFNIPLLPHYLSSIILASSDRIIIKNLVGDTAAGIYGFSYSLSSLLNIIITPLFGSLLPWFFRMLIEKKYIEIKRIFSIISIIMAIILIYAILFCPELILIFGGKKYNEASKVIPILMASEYLSVYYIQFTRVEFKYKKTIAIMISSIICAGLNIGLNFWLIPIYGYIAAAYTTLFCYSLYTLFHYVSSYLVLKKNIYNWLLYLFIYFIIVFIALVAFVIYKYLILRIVLIIIFTIIIVTLCIIIYKNKERILQMLKKS